MRFLPWPEAEPCRCSNTPLRRVPGTPPRPQTPGEEGPHGQPAGTSGSLQVGATACSTFGKHLPSTFYVFSARRIEQQTPQAATEETTRHGEETALSRTCGGENRSLLITGNQAGSATACHLASVSPPLGPKTQSQPSLG